MKEKVKERLKGKLKLSDGKYRHLSAQEFDALTEEERENLKLAIEEDGEDYNEYERRIKGLFPKDTGLPKVATWRSK